MILGYSVENGWEWLDYLTRETVLPNAIFCYKLLKSGTTQYVNLSKDKRVFRSSVRTRESIEETGIRSQVGYELPNVSPASIFKTYAVENADKALKRY